jgi:hypothetical protein
MGSATGLIDMYPSYIYEVEKMKGDYGSMAWVNDEKGKEYVCTVDVKHTNEKKYENLSKEERKTCQDVNQFVGTERW